MQIEQTANLDLFCGEQFWVGLHLCVKRIQFPGSELAQQSYCSDLVEVPTAHGLRMGSVPVHDLHRSTGCLPNFDREESSIALDATFVGKTGEFIRVGLIVSLNFRRSSAS